MILKEVILTLPLKFFRIFLILLIFAICSGSPRDWFCIFVIWSSSFCVRFCIFAIRISPFCETLSFLDCLSLSCNKFLSFLICSTLFCNIFCNIFCIFLVWKKFCVFTIRFGLFRLFWHALSHFEIMSFFVFHKSILQ